MRKIRKSNRSGLHCAGGSTTAEGAAAPWAAALLTLAIGVGVAAVLLAPVLTEPGYRALRAPLIVASAAGALLLAGAAWAVWSLRRRLRATRRELAETVEALERVGAIASERRRRLRSSAWYENLGRLVGAVVHNFRNHLQVINGYCDLLLREQGAPANSRDCIQEIRSAGQRATRMSTQLLALTRETGGQVEVLGINQALEEMVKPLSRVIGERLQLSILPAPDVAPVRLDPVALHQSMLSLIGYLNERLGAEGAVTVETADTSVSSDAGAHPPGRYAMIRLSSAASMDTDAQAVLLGVVERHRPDGPAWRLELARQMVQRVGGFIEVHNFPDQGGAIELYLPAVEGAPVETAPEPGHETILLVENDPAVRRLLSQQLRDAGYTVLETSTDAAAQRMVQSHPVPVDLLIADVILTDMTGPELAGRLAETAPQMRTLYITGHAEVLASVEHQNHLLVKPFNSRELARAVRAALDVGRAPHDVRRA